LRKGLAEGHVIIDQIDGFRLFHRTAGAKRTLHLMTSRCSDLGDFGRIMDKLAWGCGHLWRDAGRRRAYR
jgi:hypothetical protein